MACSICDLGSRHVRLGETDAINRFAACGSRRIEIVATGTKHNVAREALIGVDVFAGRERMDFRRHTVVGTNECRHYGQVAWKDQQLFVGVCM